MNTALDQSEAIAWGSHLPLLLAAIGATSGPVLELGVGHFSTPLLHALCGAMKRELCSVEEDANWHRAFARYESDGHRVLKAFEYAAIMPSLLLTRWSVAFIDHSPGGVNRAEAFASLIGITEYVVVHDYHLDNEEHISPLLANLNVHISRTYQPPTLIAATHKTIPDAIRCL